MPPSIGPAPPSPDSDVQSLSTARLLRQILETGLELVSTQVELVRAELKADLRAQLEMFKLIAAGALGALLGLNLLLVAVVIVLSRWMPAWAAAVGLGVLLIAVGLIVAAVGWKRRVSAPLAVSRKTVKEDLEWAKQRLA